MIIEKAFFELLKSIGGLGVGSGSSVRIYMARAPQGTSGPFIVFQRISTDQWRTISGPCNMAQALMQVDCYAELPYDAKLMADRLAAGIDSYRGTVTVPGSSPTESTRFAGVSLQNAIDIFDQTDQPYLHRVSQDYLVTFEK